MGPRSARSAGRAYALADGDDVALDPGAVLVALPRHLLLRGQDPLDLAEVHEDVAGVAPLLDDARDDVALLARSTPRTSARPRRRAAAAGSPAWRWTTAIRPKPSGVSSYSLSTAARPRRSRPPRRSRARCCGRARRGPAAGRPRCGGRRRAGRPRSPRRACRRRSPSRATRPRRAVMSMSMSALALVRRPRRSRAVELDLDLARGPRSRTPPGGRRPSTSSSTPSSSTASMRPVTDAPPVRVDRHQVAGRPAPVPREGERVVDTGRADLEHVGLRRPSRRCCRARRRRAGSPQPRRRGRHRRPGRPPPGAAGGVLLPSRKGPRGRDRRRRPRGPPPRVLVRGSPLTRAHPLVVVGRKTRPSRVSVAARDRSHAILPCVPRTAPAVVSRRAALAGAVGLAAGAGLAGCTSTPKKPKPPGPTSEPRPGADETARRAAAAREQEAATLAGTVATSVATHRELAAAASAAATVHAAHAAALLEGLKALRSPTATPSASVTASPSTSSIAVPASAAAGQLAALQTSVATAHQGALDGVSGPLARLLASVAASDLAHAARVRRAPTSGTS